MAKLKYKIYVERYAQKQLMRLDRKAIQTIKSKIAKLADNPRPRGYIKLKGEDAYRVRVGNYRIIYEICDDVILVNVVAKGHRKNIYKK